MPININGVASATALIVSRFSFLYRSSCSCSKFSRDDSFSSINKSKPTSFSADFMSDGLDNSGIYSIIALPLAKFTATSNTPGTNESTFFELDAQAAQVIFITGNDCFTDLISPPALRNWAVTS